MKRKLLTLAIVWLFTNSAFAQKENYVWYFGTQAGVDFNSGSPVALTNGVMDQGEGCASISDASGNLLFYTDGITVWDRNHTQMPNGDSLAGGYSTTQSALIVPFPGNNLLYYIFTAPQDFAAPFNFSYSIADISLNSGYGDVTIKNTILKSPVTEKLTAVKHANGNDVWVMVHGYGNDSLFAYLVSAGGIAATPVASKTGQVILLNNHDAVGYMKFSPDGTKLAFAAYINNYVDLFDFNSTTGLVSNEKYLPLPFGNVYGLEFSPNGNFLYCSLDYLHLIYQWDISSNSATIINSTLQQVGNSTASALAAMQSGPDGKIYVSMHLASALGVINYPDSSGASCNYVDNAVSLAGKTCKFGLPNFITSYFLPTGISNLQPPTSDLQIYPNPAIDKITISFAATTTENVTIKIYSITGEIVFEEKNKSTAPITNYQLPVTNLTNGIYFLSVQTGREVVTKKIVVNH